MRVLFFGSGEFGIPTFRSLRTAGHEIVAVVSQPDRPAGRGKHLTPTPLKQFAVEQSTPVITPADCNAPDVVAACRDARADLAFVAAFGQKIGSELLTMFPVGIVNLHASLLPAYRGAAPAPWAILRGERETGVTVFRIVEKMDAGPILAQRRTAIAEEETSDMLLDRLARIGCDATNAALERLAANPADPGDPQDPALVTLAPKFRKSDGCVDFAQPARTVSRRINALHPWPGAAARFVSADGRRDEPITIAQAFPIDEDSVRGDPGRLDDALHAHTGSGVIEIMAVKPANGRLMKWSDYVNGRHVRPGDRIVSEVQARSVSE